MCYDEASCETQMTESPASMSSKSWPSRRYLSGIFSDASAGHVSFFSDANVVLIGYCSGAPPLPNPHAQLDLSSPVDPTP